MDLTMTKMSVEGHSRSLEPRAPCGLFVSK